MTLVILKSCSMLRSILIQRLFSSKFVFYFFNKGYQPPDNKTTKNSRCYAFTCSDLLKLCRSQALKLRFTSHQHEIVCANKQQNSGRANLQRNNIQKLLKAVRLQLNKLKWTHHVKQSVHGKFQIYSELKLFLERRPLRISKFYFR